MGDGLISRPAMNDTVAKLLARSVPPFLKGGLGGISGCHAGATITQNPPRPPFRKGGRPEKPLCNSVMNGRATSQRRLKPTFSPIYGALLRSRGIYPPVGDLQALRLIDELDAAIRALGLYLRVPDGSQRINVCDVQVWRDGNVSFRVDGSSLA